MQKFISNDFISIKCLEYDNSYRQKGGGFGNNFTCSQFISEYFHDFFFLIHLSIYMIFHKINA